MKKPPEIQKVFNFNPSNQQIRVEMINSEPWFVAKDVCDCLELINSRKATSALDDDERGVSPIVTPSGKQEMTVVNESGLYNLIFQSRKPQARAFRKWVTSEVLPAIRKTGKYEAWQNGSMMYYEPTNNAELMSDFQIIAYREIVKIDNRRVRNRLAKLIDYVCFKVKL
jgi:prophage antirepressor-like protein